MFFLYSYFGITIDKMTFSNMKCGRSPQLYHRWKELCSPSGLPGSSKAVVIAAVLCVCVCVCVCVAAAVLSISA